MFNKTTYNLRDLVSGDHINIPSNSLVQVEDYNGAGQLFFFTLKDNRNLSDFSTLSAWMTVYSDRWEPLGDGIEHIYSNTDSSLRLVFPNITPFKFKITLASNENSFELPLNGAYNYHFRVHWGDGESSVVNSASDPEKEHIYATSGGTYNIEIYGKFEAMYSNGYSDRFKIREVTQLGIVEWKSLRHAFQGCQSLTAFALGDYDISDVTDFSSMFRDCYALSTYEHFDTSSAVSLNATWRNCNSLSGTFDLYNSNLGNCENLSEAFFNCYGITSFGDSINHSIDASNVKYFNSTFYNTRVPTLNITTTSGEQFVRMLEAATQLTCLNRLDTSNKTDTSYLFQNTPKLGNPDAQEQTDILNGTNWVNYNNRPCPGIAPSVITNFNATDTSYSEITVTFSDASGSPDIYYDLYSQNGLVASDISSGYVWSTIGTYDLYVKAHNYAGSTDSNHDSGTGVDPVLYITLAQSSATITLRTIIDNVNTENRTKVQITNNYVQPRIRSGDLSGLTVTFINNGEIQANQFSGTGLELSSNLTLINNGWIRGAGGNGGIGGTGGKGADISWSSGSTVYNYNSTFTVPAYVHTVQLCMIGGGGGGSRNVSNDWRKGGGRAGTVYSAPVSVTPGANITITVGAGGGPNAAGTASKFGSSTAAGGASGISSNTGSEYYKGNGASRTTCYGPTTYDGSAKGISWGGQAGFGNGGNAGDIDNGYGGGSSGGIGAGGGGEHNDVGGYSGGKGKVIVSWSGGTITGGAGGAGGTRGYGDYFGHSKTAGGAGLPGAPSTPSGGYSGGAGGNGGAGGSWGQSGASGQSGAQGQGGGSYGTAGGAGYAGGNSISGSGYLNSGSVTGNLSGAVS